MKKLYVLNPYMYLYGSGYLIFYNMFFGDININNIGVTKIWCNYLKMKALWNYTI